MERACRSRRYNRTSTMARAWWGGGCTGELYSGGWTHVTGWGKAEGQNFLKWSHRLGQQQRQHRDCGGQRTCVITAAAASLDTWKPSAASCSAVVCSAVVSEAMLCFAWGEDECSPVPEGVGCALGSSVGLPWAEEQRKSEKHALSSWAKRLMVMLTHARSMRRSAVCSQGEVCQRLCASTARMTVSSPQPITLSSTAHRQRLRSFRLHYMSCP